MEVYYKITDYSYGIKKLLFFTNNVYIKRINFTSLDLYGISLLYKCNYWYDYLNEEDNYYRDFMIPLSLEEINDTIDNYGSLL